MGSATRSIKLWNPLNVAIEALVEAFGHLEQPSIGEPDHDRGTVSAVREMRFHTFAARSPNRYSRYLPPRFEAADFNCTHPALLHHGRTFRYV